MTKLSLAAASLAAALPAALLAFFLGKDLVGSFGDMATMVQVFSVLTLLCCALAVLLPPGILVFGPKGAAAESRKKDNEKGKEPAKEKEKDKGKGKAKAIEDDELTAASGDDFELADDELVEPDALSTDDLETVDFEDEDDKK